MFQYDKDTICKVVESSELEFYQSMPDSLKMFTPQFRGKILASDIFDTHYLLYLTSFQVSQRANIVKMNRDILNLLYSDNQLVQMMISYCLKKMYPKQRIKKQWIIIQENQYSKQSCCILKNVRYSIIFDRVPGSDDGLIDYSNSLDIDNANYEQGKVVTSKINPWSLQLIKKQANKLHLQVVGDENANVSQSKYSKDLNYKNVLLAQDYGLALN